MCIIGCVGKCAANPCLNGGICKEKYHEFICDCSYTPFRGLICGRGKFTDSLHVTSLVKSLSPTQLIIMAGKFSQEIESII